LAWLGNPRTMDKYIFIFCLFLYFFALYSFGWVYFLLLFSPAIRS
jgi:hypothetical protein